MCCSHHANTAAEASTVQTNSIDIHVRPLTQINHGTQYIAYLIPRLIFQSHTFTFTESSVMKVQGIEPGRREFADVSRHVNFFASCVPVQTDDSWHGLPVLRPSSPGELTAYFQSITIEVNVFMFRLVVFV